VIVPKGCTDYHEYRIKAGTQIESNRLRNWENEAFEKIPNARIRSD